MTPLEGRAGCYPARPRPQSHHTPEHTMTTETTDLRQRIADALDRLYETGAVYALEETERDRIADAVLPLFAAEREAEAHPPVRRWYPEVLDGDHWVPYGSAKSDRAAVVRLLEASERGRPQWDDGTPVQRRLIRETTTYTVEDARADAEDGGK